MDGRKNEGEKIEKITSRVLGFGYVKWLESRHSEIHIPEFKFLITRCGARKKEWFGIAKTLEENGICKVRGGNPILINLSSIDREKNSSQ